MIEDHDESSCLPLTERIAQCQRRHCRGRGQQGTPLPETCCNRRMRVCAISGDRMTCAKMANLGVRPGSELELLCKGGGQQCMIKIDGSTLSLDAPTAATIMVAPA